MANLAQLNAEEASQIADEEFDKLEKCEDLLDHMVVLFRKITIQLIGEKAGDAVAELKEAIELAKAAIKKTGQVKHAIKLAANPVDPAVALSSKNPKSILNAAKSFREAARADAGAMA